jgi:hypothetical protein
MKTIPLICGATLLTTGLLVLSGCATSGVMQGRTDGKLVQLHYHHSFWNQNGTIRATMPDGERFSGRFVIGTTDTTGFGVGSGGGFGIFTGGGNTSRASAVLMGDRGDSMHCMFELAHPSDDLEGGGIGRCKLSSGQVIDATFK